MELQNFLDTMQGCGLKVNKKAAYGSHEGYPFVAEFFNKNLFSVTFFVAGKVNGSLRRALKNQLSTVTKEIRVNVIPAQLAVQFQVNPRQSDISALLNIVLETAVYIMPAQNVLPSHICPVCKQSDCDCYALFAGKYAAAHYSCIEQQAKKATEQIEKNDLQGNYPLGILGAIIGAFVGAIPTFILLYATNTIYSLLYALIPICSYYGYKLLRGKMTRAVTVIVALLSFAMVYIVDVAFIYTQAIASGFQLSVFDAFLFYHELYTVPEMMESMGMPFLFTVLGIFISWGIIRQTNTTVLAQTQNTMDTISPIPGVTLPTASAASTAAQVAFVQNATASNFTPPSPAPAQDVVTNAAPDIVPPKEDITNPDAKKEKDPWEL